MQHYRQDVATIMHEEQCKEKDNFRLCGVPDFFSLITWSWKSELVAYECCHPIIRGVVMGAMQA